MSTATTMTTQTALSHLLCVDLFTDVLKNVAVQNKFLLYLGSKVQANSHSHSHIGNKASYSYNSSDCTLSYPPPLPGLLGTAVCPPMSVSHHPWGLCTVQLAAHAPVPNPLELIDPTIPTPSFPIPSLLDWANKSEINKLVLVISTSADEVPSITREQADALFPLPPLAELVLIFRRAAASPSHPATTQHQHHPQPAEPKARIPLLPALIDALVPVLYTAPVTFVDPAFMVPAQVAFPASTGLASDHTLCRPLGPGLGAEIQVSDAHEDMYEPLQESIYLAVERTFELQGRTCTGDGYQASHNWDMMTSSEYRARIGDGHFKLETM